MQLWGRKHAEGRNLRLKPAYTVKGIRISSQRKVRKGKVLAVWITHLKRQVLLVWKTPDREVKNNEQIIRPG